jgi:K+-transporting ATPase ATPase C chain
MKTVLKESLTAVLMTTALAVIVCAAYPLVVFVVAQGLFPAKANGSILYHNGTAAGSELLGQPFESARYFHPRPSSAGAGYDGTASGGSNLGPTSKTLITNVQERVARYRAENQLPDHATVPVDVVTASGSGLDPHISVENATLQAARVANARSVDVKIVLEYIRRQTENRALGILGEPRVNVLLLNLAMEREKETGTKQ